MHDFPLHQTFLFGSFLVALSNLPHINLINYLWNYFLILGYIILYTHMHTNRTQLDMQTWPNQELRLNYQCMSQSPNITEQYSFLDNACSKRGGPAAYYYCYCYLSYDSLELAARSPNPWLSYPRYTLMSFFNSLVMVKLRVMYLPSLTLYAVWLKCTSSIKRENKIIYSI